MASTARGSKTKDESEHDKQIKKTDKDVHGLSRRLNPGFKAKAPAHVVAEFEVKLEAARERLQTLQAARTRLD